MKATEVKLMVKKINEESVGIAYILGNDIKGIMSITKEALEKCKFPYDEELYNKDNKYQGMIEELKSIMIEHKSIDKFFMETSIYNHAPMYV